MEINLVGGWDIEMDVLKATKKVAVKEFVMVVQKVKLLAYNWAEVLDQYLVAVLVARTGSHLALMKAGLLV